jgi:hypothetical protein
MVALLVGLEAEGSRGRRDKESGEVGFESRQHRNLLASVRRDGPSSNSLCNRVEEKAPIVKVKFSTHSLRHGSRMKKFWATDVGTSE